MRSQHAVFLDKDGTIVKDVPYNADPSRLCLMPGVIEGLQTLIGAGYVPIIVSNQSGVALGRFGESGLVRLSNGLKRLLGQHEIRLGGCYFCPHHPDGVVPRFAIPCECRKPRPGMLHRAARELRIDLQSSWMIGDILDDVEAGNRAGCQTVLIDNGGETEWQRSEARNPTFVAGDLEVAANLILKHSNPRPVMEHAGAKLISPL